MKRAVKVSVIVPMYNVAQWLPRCVNSLVNQTLHDIEIILIDDGSPDNSGKIADRAAIKDKRIKVIHQKNSGVSVARNNGIKAACGEYIGFVDPDDYVELDFFERLYNCAIDAGADICKGEVKVRDFNKQVSDWGPLCGDIIKNRVHFNYAFWSAIYKRSFITDNKINFPAGINLSEDCVFLVQSVILANKISLVSGTYYFYERRENSLCSQYLSEQKIQSQIIGTNIVIDFINNIRNLTPESYNIIFSDWLNSLLHLFERNHSFSAGILIVHNAIKIYQKCKYNELYRRKNLILADFMENQDETGLLFYILQRRESKYDLFGVIPLLRIRRKPNKTIYRLFYILPIFVIRHIEGRRLYRPLDLITLFSCK